MTPAATVVAEERWGRVTAAHTIQPVFAGASMLPQRAPLLMLEAGSGPRPYRLGGAAHSHLHIVALTGLAPQVVHHLHEAAPPAGLLGLLGVPGQSQAQGGAP